MHGYAVLLWVLECTLECTILTNCRFSGSPNVQNPQPTTSLLVFERPVQPQTDEPLYSTTQSSGESSKPYYLLAVSKNTSREENDKRQDMYGEWANLIVMNMDAFTICGALNAKNRYFSRSDLTGTIQSCLAWKATSTIQRRLSAMGKYAEWCTTHGRELFPLAEHAMYDYMLHLRNADSPVPTSGKSFMESVHFTCGVFGLGCDEFVLRSTRISGLAEELARSGGGKLCHWRFCRYPSLNITVETSSRLVIVAWLEECWHYWCIPLVELLMELVFAP